MPDPETKRRCDFCGYFAHADDGIDHDGGWYCCDDCVACHEDGEPHYDDPAPYYDEGDDWQIDGVGFADPGGRSALRAATRDNPRNLPCPTCGEPNRLTPLDRRAGYQCDQCADRAEGLLPC